MAQRLARPHPVDVAAQGVDLPVVGDIAEGVGERPGREGVGREALVDHGQRRLHRRIDDVGEHGLDLETRQHALVDEGPVRQARDIEELALREIGVADGVLDAHADHVEPALEAVVVEPGGAPDEDLLEIRLGRACGRADRGIVGRHDAPADQALAFLADDRR